MKKYIVVSCRTYAVLFSANEWIDAQSFKIENEEHGVQCQIYLIDNS